MAYPTKITNSIFILVSLVIFQSLCADEWDDAYAAFKNGDYVSAFKGFQRFADLGDPTAQDMLGTMYHIGRCVPENYKEAVIWYRRAAEQGHIMAQFSLGAMYFEGKGVQQDFTQAHAWLNLAASQGSEDARQVRELAAQQMSRDQIAEAQALAKEWAAKYNKE